MTTPPVVSEAKWIEARQAIQAQEKEKTRQRHELAPQRRELPWGRVDQNYRFAKGYNVGEKWKKFMSQKEYDSYKKEDIKEHF